MIGDAAVLTNIGSATHVEIENITSDFEYDATSKKAIVIESESTSSVKPVEAPLSVVTKERNLSASMDKVLLVFDTIAGSAFFSALALGLSQQYILAYAFIMVSVGFVCVSFTLKREKKHLLN
jgi:hypothetical protein